jgi:hypothetical protein
MDQQRRLSVLKRMLARLTGVEPEPEVIAPAVPDTPVRVAVSAPVLAQPAPDPRERRLRLLQSMLSKLQGS